jgi:MerR family transcriptional regulator/heat shock protein HspR
MYGYDEPLYMISVIAKILDIHPQTLRQYEREGLIKPSRTSGRVRLYSQRDIDKIEMIIRLTRKLGVNLAGVDIILRLKEKIDELEYELQLEKTKTKSSGIVPQNKAIVTTSISAYEMIIKKQE